MQSWLEGRNWVGKCAQATGITASLRILSSKADLNMWESFTRSELKLESVHQESPRSDIFRKRATKPLLKQKHRRLRRKWTGLLLSGRKSSFQMKVNFAFNLEIKVPESGGRVERHRIHVSWSPVWSFHRQWWFWVPWRLLVLVHCVSSQENHIQTISYRNCVFIILYNLRWLLSCLFLLCKSLNMYALADTNVVCNVTTASPFLSGQEYIPSIIHISKRIYLNFCLSIY